MALVAATTLAVGAVGGVLLARATSGRQVGAQRSLPLAGAPTAEKARRELLVISTTPAGATIEIDGERLPETTPAAVHGLAPGPHTVRLSAPGRAAVERKLSMTPDGRVSLVVNLPPTQRSVLVRSVPAGATIYLDNHIVGPAPATVVVNEDDFHDSLP
jgi:hypothetical protein